MSRKVTTAYGYGRPFNAGPPQALLSSVGQPQTGRSNSEGNSERLMLLETTTTSGIIPASLLGSLPSLRDHHVQGRSARLSALRHLKWIHSDHPQCKGHWVVVNTDRFVVIPSPNSSGSGSHPQWLGSFHPALGFTPTFGVNEGYAINPIRIPDSVVNNVISPAHEGGYKLDFAVSTMWYEIECHFVAIARMLRVPLGHLPSFPSPPQPSTHRYQEVHTTAQLAVQSVRAAREAFLQWTTFLSFLLSFWRYADAVYPFATLLNHCKRHLPAEYPFLHELVHSTNVGDFRLTTRAGYIVDLRKPSPWIQFLHIWAEAGVPLWVYGGPDPQRLLKSAPTQYPSVREALVDWVQQGYNVQAVYSQYIAHMSASIDPPLLKQERIVGDEKGILYGLSHFGFRDGDYEPGMHPGYYFPLRDSALHSWKVSKGSPADSLARAQVSIARWTKEFDGRTVYVWELERDSWMRRRIVPPLRRPWFETFDPSCRRWCPILREIDLCRWLGEPRAVPVVPTSRAPESNTRSLLSQPSAIPSSPRAFNPAQSPPHPVHTSSYQYTPFDSDEDEYESDGEDSERQPPTQHSASLQSASDVRFNPSSLRSLGETLLVRLGYDADVPLPHYQNHIGETIFARGDKANLIALRCLGHGKTGGIEDGQLRAAVDASQSLLAFGKEVGSGNWVYGRGKLPTRWDISPLRSSIPQVPPGLAIHRVSATNKSGDVLPRCILAMKDAPIENQWWVLVVEPSTLMQIFRSEVTGIMQAGPYLIQNGLPFSTAILSRSEEMPVARPVIRTGLGSLITDARLSNVDYTAYESKKNEFLQSPRGALALKCGGIVWRIAIDGVNSERVKRALTRPTQRAEKVGFLCATSSDGAKYVDDALEAHELDIILGAYRFRSRNPSKPTEWNQEHCIFLWPTPAAWSRSGMNTGEWSSDAEEWYQFHKGEIQNGMGKLRSSSAWKQALKNQSETRSMWKNYDDAVMDALFD